MRGSSIDGLQQRVSRWALEQFGELPADEPAKGLGEELGECASEFIHYDDETGILSTKPVAPQDIDKVIDACADWAIFGFNFCEYLGLDLLTLHKITPPLDAHTIWAVWPHVLVQNGKIQQALLKRRQKIRGFDDPDKFREQIEPAIGLTSRACEWLCNHFGQDYLAAVATVAETVLRRDWRKNPETAAQVAEQKQ